MHIKSIILTAFAYYSVADAICVMRAWGGPNCNGDAGAVVEVTKGNKCINVKGRKSYHFYGGSCNHVRIIKYEGNKCSGTPFSTNDLRKDTCYGMGDVNKMNIKMV